MPNFGFTSQLSIFVGMGRQFNVHDSCLTDVQIRLLCHNYSLKGLHLKYKITDMQISVIVSLHGQGLQSVSMIARLLKRAKQVIHLYLGTCINKGLIEKIGIRYRLTLLGLDVYNTYLLNYEAMRVNLEKLEALRVSRLHSYD
jgi:hypothetical protein